jgi:hypothetical protein
VVPDPSVQPPEGLRRLISKALFVVDWDIEPGTRGAYDKRADAVLAALFDADALITPPGQRATTDPIEPCTYLSTACDHGLHDRCRISCKFCGSYCVCRDCDHDPEPDQP